MKKYKNLEYETGKLFSLRPWGVEVKLFVTDTKKREYNLIMLFKKEPSENAITEMAIFWMEKILSEKEIVPEKMFSEKEILTILKDKNIIEESIKKVKDIKKKEKKESLQMVGRLDG
jgi:hypothetical protein